MVEVEKQGELGVSLLYNIQDILDLLRFCGTVLAGMLVGVLIRERGIYVVLSGEFLVLS